MVFNVISLSIYNLIFVNNRHVDSNLSGASRES